MLFKKREKKQLIKQPEAGENASGNAGGNRQDNESKPQENAGNKKKWNKKRIMHFAVLGALVFGIFVMAFPSLMDSYNWYITKKAADNYVAEVEEIEPEDLTAYWDAAKAYNAMIRSSTDRWHSSDAEHEAYENALNYSGSGIMGYVQCDKIGLKLPFYHGTDAAVLQVAAGHLEGSSLPTGELGNHVVLSGHTGLANAELFNNVDQLEIGDKFILTVLDEMFTYEVDQITIVEPSDLTKIEFDDDQDYVTLETCTPYGINSHRLLVRGHRVENEPEKTGPEKAALWWETMLLRLKGMIEHEPEAMIIISIVIVLVLVLILKSRKDNPKVQEKKEQKKEKKQKKKEKKKQGR